MCFKLIHTKKIILLFSVLVLLLAFWVNSHPRIELPLLKLFGLITSVVRLTLTDGTPLGYFQYVKKNPLPIFPQEGYDNQYTNFTTRDGYILTMLIQTPKKKSKENYDVLFEIHGGGFVMGDHNFVHVLRTFFKEDDASVVLFSPEYRLAPEYPFPYAVEDVYDGLLWVRANAKKYGANPDRIIVGGTSAGGNLAAVTSILARDDTKFTPKPIAQILHVPLTNIHLKTLSTIQYMDTPIWNTPLSIHARYYYAAYKDWNDFRVSPGLALTHKSLPPAFIIVNRFDPLFDDGVEYEELLKKDGVPAELYIFDTYHAGESISHILGGYKAEVAECRVLLKKFLEKNAKH